MDGVGTLSLPTKGGHDEKKIGKNEKRMPEIQSAFAGVIETLSPQPQAD